LSLLLAHSTTFSLNICGPLHLHPSARRAMHDGALSLLAPSIGFQYSSLVADREHAPHSASAAIISPTVCVINPATDRMHSHTAILRPYGDHHSVIYQQQQRVHGRRFSEQRRLVLGFAPYITTTVQKLWRWLLTRAGRSGWLDGWMVCLLFLSF
jgi:hypothetical protein